MSLLLKIYEDALEGAPHFVWIGSAPLTSHFHNLSIDNVF